MARRANLEGAISEMAGRLSDTEYELSAERFATALENVLVQAGQAPLPPSLMSCAKNVLMGISESLTAVGEDVPERVLAQAQDLGRLFRKENQQLGDVFRTVSHLRQVARRIEIQERAVSEPDAADFQDRLDRWFEDIVFAAVNTYYEVQRSELQKRIVVDGLTGVFNRAYFGERFAEELERGRRYSHPVTLLMIDLDSLKPINDRYGHRAGDTVLKIVSREIRSQCRSVDVVARYGGDEFAVIMPQTKPEGGWILAERAARAVFENQTGDFGGMVSISVGIASFPKDAVTPEGLVDAADKALYRAKRDGGNSVAAFGSQVVTKVGSRMNARRDADAHQKPDGTPLALNIKSVSARAGANESYQLERQNVELMVSLVLAKKKLALYEKLENMIPEIVDGSLRAAVDMGLADDNPPSKGGSSESESQELTRDISQLRAECDLLQVHLTREKAEAAQALDEVRAQIERAKSEAVAAETRRDELEAHVTALEQKRDLVQGQVTEVLKQVVFLSDALKESDEPSD